MPDEKKPVTLADVVKPIETKPEETATADSTEDKFEIPQKYEGKSLEDVIKMHQNVEQALSRQGAELGEVRRLADSLINSDLQKRATPEPNTSDEKVTVDLFEDPDKATQVIDRLIDRKVKEKLTGVESKLGEVSQQAIISRLDRDHPDWKTILGSQEYLDWVNSSSVRMRLADEGNRGIYESGSELLNMWKALHPAKKADESKEEGDSQTDKLKRASLEDGPSRRTSTTGKPIYRLKDLEELRMKDPDRYYSMKPEIREAFQERRVK